jgi:dolichol kinase
MQSPMFWFAELLKMALLGGIAYGCGLLVRERGMKVNYTRKINFFALYLVPMLVDRLFPTVNSPEAASVRAVFFMLLMAFFLKPVRERLKLAGTMFLSYDRPEDRPHTMFWLTTQLLAGYAVLIPMQVLFRKLGFAELIFIPILVHGFGDGLAEPVGVRFGKHKYSCRSLFNPRRYTRSLEGSACVFVAGLVAVIAFHASFTPAQFIAALLVVPLGMTLAEAFSPHTWDTPYMFLVGTGSLLGIMRFCH